MLAATAGHMAAMAMDADMGTVEATGAPSAAMADMEATATDTGPGLPAAASVLLAQAEVKAFRLIQTKRSPENPKRFKTMTLSPQAA
jgi:hypothetical protein